MRPSFIVATPEADNLPFGDRQVDAQQFASTLQSSVINGAQDAVACCRKRALYQKTAERLRRMFY